MKKLIPHVVIVGGIGVALLATGTQPALADRDIAKDGEVLDTSAHFDDYRGQSYGNQDKEFDQVLNGTGRTLTVNGKTVPKYGCEGVARLATDGTTSQESQWKLGENLMALGLDRTQRSAVFRKLHKQWGNCMIEKGHQPRKRYMFPAGVKGRSDGTPATKREIAVALDDLKCRRAVDVAGKLSKVEARLERRLVREYRALLEQERIQQRRSVQRANDIVRAHLAENPN